MIIYTALIALKNGNFITIENFKEVRFGAESNRADKFEEFRLHSNRSYTFVGDDIICMLGNEILYLSVS